MQQILDALKQSMLNEHLPNEQIQNILSSVDITQLNLQDLPATQEYLSQFLADFNLQENIISHINTTFFENLGIENIPNLNIEDGIMGNIQNLIGGLFGGE
jgi:hypothetical protein